MSSSAVSQKSGQVVRAGHRKILAVLCLALASVVSAVASLNVAIPSIAQDTHATQTELSWIIDAYGLVFAALLLLGGAMGDRYGRRLMLLVGLAIFGAAAAAAMMAGDATVLIALRGVLGVGAALVMPATLSTITSTFPEQEKGRAIGIWAGIAGASAVLGLLTSGIVLEWWSWRAVFALNVILAVAAVIGTLRFVPESADPRAPRLDVVGAGITVAGLGVLVYSIIEAPDAGWTSVRSVGGALLGLALLAGFAWWETQVEHPLLDPRLFRIRAFAAGSVSLTLQFFAFFGFIFLILQYLQLVEGNSPLLAAVSLIPMAIGMMPAARTAPVLAARIGTRATCTIGLIVLAGGLVVLAQLGQGSSYWLVLAGMIPSGVGMGLAMTPATTAVTDALPTAQQGVGSAMNDLARELGGALGIAVLGSVLQAGYRSVLHPVGLPAALAEQARSSLAMALRIGGPTAGDAQGAFVAGMQDAFLLGAGAALVAAAAVLILRRDSAPASSTPAG